MNLILSRTHHNYTHKFIRSHYTYCFQNIYIRGLYLIFGKDSIKAAVPVHKSDNKRNVKNYHGISKLTVFQNNRKNNYDNLFPLIRPLLIPQQHSFVNKRSTETNLCEFLDEVLYAKNCEYYVDVNYTGFSKTLEKKSHSMLINKIKQAGIHDDLLRWLEPYPLVTC